MTDFELSEKEKNKIRYRLSLNDENKLFEVITDIVKERVKLIAPIWKNYQREVTGGAERDFYTPEQKRLYNLFLELDEQYKNGKKTKYFVNYVKNTTNLSIKTLQNYYPEFVKKYQKEKEYIAGGLKEIDDNFYEYVIENFKNS